MSLAIVNVALLFQLTQEFVVLTLSSIVVLVVVIVASAVVVGR